MCRQTVAAVKVRSTLITDPLIYNELYENLELTCSKNMNEFNVTVGKLKPKWTQTPLYQRFSG